MAASRSTACLPLSRSLIRKQLRRFRQRWKLQSRNLCLSGGGKIPPNLKLPLRDGDIDRPEDEAYKGCYFFNANSRQAPQVVDKQVQPILDQTEVYSGCYGRISVNFYGYNSNGNRGVAAGLGNIQKLKDGEALSSRTNAEDDFEAVEDEDFLG